MPDKKLGRSCYSTEKQNRSNGSSRQGSKHEIRLHKGCRWIRAIFKTAGRTMKILPFQA